MANRHCTRCGREVVAGKRFCGGCGQAIPVEAPPSTSIGGLPPAKPIDEAMKPQEALAEKPVYSEAGFTAAAETPWSSTPSFGPKAIPIPEWEPIKEAGAIPPVNPQAVAKVIPSSPKAVVEFIPASPQAVAEVTPASPQAVADVTPASPQPKRRIGLMIGLAAAVLFAAGGGWAWYAYSHRCVSCTAKSAASTPQSTAQGGTSATPNTTVQPDKPPADTAEVTDAGAPLTPPQPAFAPITAPEAPAQPRTSSQSGHGSPAAPTRELSVIRAPAIVPPPRPLPPVQARSGVRHYQGPPVLHGGMVVFDNLPKARLRFTFDRAAWEMILKTNPDGTKKAILISQAQGSLSSCDLGWELID